MTKEDFDRWLDDPVTRWVLASFERGAEDQKAAWDAASWENGVASQNMLQELRVRADAYRAMGAMTYETVCNVMGVKPRDE